MASDCDFNLSKVLDSRQSWQQSNALLPWFLVNLAVVTALGVDVGLCDGGAALAVFAFAASVADVVLVEKTVCLLGAVNALVTATLLLRPLVVCRRYRLTECQRRLLGVSQRHATAVVRTTDGAIGRPLSTWRNLDWLFRTRRVCSTPITSPSTAYVSRAESATEERYRRYSPTDRTPNLSFSPNMSVSSYPTPQRLDLSDVSVATVDDSVDKLKRCNQSASASGFIYTQDKLKEYLQRYDCESPQQSRDTSDWGSRRAPHTTSYEMGSVTSAASPTLDDSPVSLHRRSAFRRASDDSRLFATAAVVPSSPAKRATPPSILRRRSPFSPTVYSVADGSPLASHSLPDAWLSCGLEPYDVDLYVQNVRSWISCTVLKRVVKQIDEVNAYVEALSRADLRVGEATIAALQSAAAASMSAKLAVVPQLVAYLSVTTNQRYVVSRLRQLARDGCLLDFRWNGGGSDAAVAGRDRLWDADHLPTDTELVWHLVCTYLDVQLPPNARCVDGRPFTARYFDRSPESPAPSSAASPRIQQVSGRPSCRRRCPFSMTTNPPHFRVLGGDPPTPIDIPKGANNFFHALLLFLQLCNITYDGRLDSISLGPSGLNVLWIFDSLKK